MQETDKDQLLQGADGMVFTGDDIRSGQQIFLKYGLMENGSVLGHGAYLGPDFSAAYLHDLGQVTASVIALQSYGQSYESMDAPGQAAVQTEVALILKQNRYDAQTSVLTYTQPEVDTFQAQQTVWADYFSKPGNDAGLQAKLMGEQFRMRQEMLSVLTPEQKTQLEQKRAEFKAKRANHSERKVQ